MYAKVLGGARMAACTAVDAAGKNEELCRRINADGTRNIAMVCKKLDIKMIYISTDYVPDREGEWFWEPDDGRAVCEYTRVWRAGSPSGQQPHEQGETGGERFREASGMAGRVKEKFF